MIYEEFKKRINKANIVDICIEYFVSFFFLGGSIYLICIFNKKWYHIQPVSVLAAVDICAILVFIFGLFAFRSISNRYKIINIVSSLPVNEKKKIIEKLAGEYLNYTVSETNGFYFFTFSRKWYSSNYDIRLACDESNFFFSVQVRSGPNGAWIDFGGSEKLRKEIEEKIKFLLK